MRTFRNISVARVPDQHSNRRWVVSVARIVQLRTVADQSEHIHFRAKFDIFVGARDTVLEREAAFGCDRNIHEEINVGRDVALLEPAAPRERRLEEALPASVHVTLLNGVANHVAFRCARAAECVVPAARIGDDGQQDVAFRRDQLCTCGEIDVRLIADRVLRRVSIFIVVRIEEKSIRRLVTFNIDNADMLALDDFVNPRLPGRYGGVMPNGCRIQRIVDSFHDWIFLFMWLLALLEQGNHS
jgi:hypothetical protein